MLTFLLAVCLAQAPDTTTVHPFKIETKYDRITDYSVVRLSLGKVFEQDENNVKSALILFYAWPHQDRERLGIYDKVRFQLVTVADTWEFLKTNSVAILAGEHRFQPESSHDGSVRDGSISESVFCNLTREQVEQMGKADSIEVAVGLHQFELKGSQVAAVRDFATRLTVSSKDAEKIDAEHVKLVRKRNMELQAEMDKAIETARKAVKKLPKSKRQAKADQVGHKALAEAMGPVVAKYHVRVEEYMALLAIYPEFGGTLESSDGKTRRP